MPKYYLSEDQKKASELGMLFGEWKESLEKQGYFQNNGISQDCFVEDGIFPGFSAQNIKILYTGRESYDLEGFHYIDIHHDWIKRASFNGKPLNQIGTWRKLLKFTWGLQHDSPWDEIPDAETIAANFAEPDGLSFAIRNLSKISRPWNGSPKSDWGVIHSFVNASQEAGMNFYQRENAIINPDLVISMNLLETFDGDVFGGNVEHAKNVGDVAIFKLTLQDRTLPLLDTWHFAATKNEADMYENIRQAHKESKLLCE